MVIYPPPPTVLIQRNGRSLELKIWRMKNVLTLKFRSNDITFVSGWHSNSVVLPCYACIVAFGILAV